MRIARGRGREGGGVETVRARATAGAGVVVTRVKYECCTIFGNRSTAAHGKTGKDNQAGGFLIVLIGVVISVATKQLA